MRGIEPPTSRTPSERSTDELHPEKFIKIKVHWQGSLTDELVPEPEYFNIYEEKIIF